jgi:two-component system, NtrC family, response regulator AtoC
MPHTRRGDGEGTVSVGPTIERAPLAFVVTLPRGSYTTVLPARGTVRIGRAEECEIFIQDPSITRVHAIVHLDGTVSIEDAGSRNGTVVLGTPLSPGERAPLPVGAVIQVGHAVLVLVRKRATAEAEAREDSMIVASEAMSGLVEKLPVIATSLLNVLILGETGVGKELAARAIHRLSARAAGPFLALNCAAIPESLIDSELFGHAKGAFTGALEAKVGLIEAASGGTLFLDEVGDLSLLAQAKLLRAIESGEVMPVGSVRTKRVDVRVVAATNRDLVARMREGGFREDLYFRVNGTSIRIPPLRERRADVGPLAEWFAERAAARLDRPSPTLDPTALAVLSAHHWPGNVRELRSVVELAVAFARGARVLRADHIQLPVERPGFSSTSATLPPPPLQVESSERERIVLALARAGGNQTVAANLLGVSRRTLIRRMEDFAIARPRKGPPA